MCQSSQHLPLHLFAARNLSGPPQSRTNVLNECTRFVDRPFDILLQKVPIRGGIYSYPREVALVSRISSEDTNQVVDSGFHSGFERELNILSELL